MAKDSKGHGSEKRGGASAVRSGSYEGKPVFHGVNSGGKVRNSDGRPIAYTTPEAAVAGANIDPKTGMTAAQRAYGSHDPRTIAAAHGVPTGHLRVQSLNTKLAGSPWRTEKRYGNRAVAERVAGHMRTDGGFMRIK